METGEQLRKDYRVTYKEYARRCDELQMLVDSGSADRSQIEAAMLGIEKARVAHNAARDCLAQQLGAAAHSPQQDSGDARVRHTAHRFWEVAGRPQGTAVSDWRSAERVVRAATRRG